MRGISFMYCPFCGNDTQEEFTTITETRCKGEKWEYENTRVVCSCGAMGPDGRDFRNACSKWNKRKDEGKEATWIK